MAPNETGRGDPDSTLRLLWRRTAVGGGKPRQGRKPRVDVDQIIAAAVITADRHGLRAMTMAKVANTLSIGTMSLYTHIPGKDELLDLMIDAVWSELDLPSIDVKNATDWRDQVTLYAERALNLYRRHPWLRDVSTVRPPLGPGLLDRQEYLLGALIGSGFDPHTADAAVTTIITFIDAAAAAEVDRAHAEDASGESEHAWWEGRQAFWEQIYDPARYPTTTRAWRMGALGRSGAEAADRARELGLRWLLDGLESTRYAQSPSTATNRPQ